MKNTKGSINSFFPPWKYNGQTLGSIFLGLYCTTKEHNFAKVMAPAPSYWSKIEGGVWDLALSGVRQHTGDYAGVEPKHWMVCFTLLFPFLWTKNGKVAGLGQLGPQGLWGEQCGMHWAVSCSPGSTQFIVLRPWVVKAATENWEKE